jgi:hypothetical protein
MNFDFLFDLISKGLIGTVLGKILFDVLNKLYKKMFKSRDADVYDGATITFIMASLVYSITCIINITILVVIYNEFKGNTNIETFSFTGMIFVSLFTFFYFYCIWKNIFLLRNKFYLLQLPGENVYVLLKEGYDIVSTNGYELVNDIPAYRDLPYNKWEDYIKYQQRYYDKTLDTKMNEVIYIHSKPIKRFFKIVSKKWITGMILVPILYIVLLCLCLNSIITNPEFIIFSIIVLYSLNFIILITATNDIYRKNDVDRYYAYYKCNEED